jgi:hypothetical protein
VTAITLPCDVVIPVPALGLPIINGNEGTINEILVK